MASITIRNLDDELKSKLRIQAAKNNRSMEEEVRTILADSLSSPKKMQTGKELFENIRRRVAPFGGIDLPEIPREEIPEPRIFE